MAPIKMPEVIDLTSETTQSDAVRLLSHWIDLTVPEYRAWAPPECAPVTLRNGPIFPPWITLDKYAGLSPGTCVELHSTGPHRNGDIFYIVHILQNTADQLIVLRGHRLVRARHMGGMLQPRRKELCLFVNAGLDDTRPFLTQGMEDVPAAEVIMPRTVAFVPAPSSGWQLGNATQPILVDSDAEFSCRYVLVSWHKSTAARTTKRAYEGELRGLYASEIAFFTGEPVGPQRVCPMSARRLPGEVTYWDGFCGLGGAAQGAKMAGARVECAFDIDEKACTTFKLNHPEAEVYRIDAHHFAQDDGPASCSPDLFHLSCPCQPWSPAHTRVGKNDEANEAALFVTSAILSKYKPKIHMQEQTFGLPGWHPTQFSALLNMISGEGYKVRWKVADLKDYGVPQKAHLLPYRTIHDAVSRIPDTAPNHRSRITWFPRPREPYNATRTMASCVLASGGCRDHTPDGRRRFTPAENLALQTLPWDYKFPARLTTGTMKKLIGNAVPPVVWSTVRVGDGGADKGDVVMDEGERRTPATPPKDAVDLTLDEEEDRALGGDEGEVEVEVIDIMDMDD
ncbi:S-adenosyl-L-methionine-dependent methyltransferase [Trichodelitschia bisporula]|uniref:DNA (cytosine-5-)-methyltransferase n=1 Tax=Trichodelitschia bisporula TaxID=703511 RepID=A0A6G1HUU6_9PEZI|nr:S-adenosyl-L-methionine-dependent methyltransferase [Trichodelitschia bisporula]